MTASNVRNFHGGRQKQNSPGRAGPALPESERGVRFGSLIPDRIPAAAVIELSQCAAALWSMDRQSCFFNDAARSLLGFCEHDFGQDPSLWLDRIPVEDRAGFLSASQKLQTGESRASCRYRFVPKGQAQPLWIREVSIRYSQGDGEEFGIWTVYFSEAVSVNRMRRGGRIRNLVSGLTHEIGNNLQAIRGEVDILRLSGVVPADSADAIYKGISQVRRLAHEIEDYLFPASAELRTEDPASVLARVIKSREKQMEADGIRTGVKLQENLPKVPLDLQFGKALTDVIDFSRVLLSKGGELNIEAGVCRQGGEKYIELNIVSSSSTSLPVEERDVFRPFCKVNGHRVGLSMAVAQQILRRHFGKVVFRKEQSNRGVFSLLIRVPTDTNPS
jgi:hypothetical protein